MKNNILTGIAAAPGISIAKANLYLRKSEIISDETIENVDEAKNNLLEALTVSKKELKKVFSLAVDKLGPARASILEAQIMILDDPVLIDNLLYRIANEKKLPEYIVNEEISRYQKMMTNANEAYLQERSLDIEDIKNRIIKNLKKKKWKSRIDSDVIVVTENLTPADTVLFSRVNVKGYVTNFGGLTSHTAIFSRSLHIPAVVGVHDATSQIHDGDLLIIDGYHGHVIINPDEEQLSDYKEKLTHVSELDQELAELRNKPAVTLDGFQIELQSNLDLNIEIDTILRNGAEGLGLVRTEQLFNEVDQFPDEDEQYETYKELAEKMYPQNVIVRTFDIGGDKVLPFDVKEPNPMLGWRGIRFMLDNINLFKTQLRAILRAGIHKNIQIMLPMISTIAEIRRSKKIINDCMNELNAEGKVFDPNIKIGIMVEVPSAAIMIYEFASEVDFVSIGTNDLVQYMLAVDRGNDIVSSQYLAYHPAVLRTVDFIIKEAKRANAKVSLCGELGAEVQAIPLLIGFGLDSVSVSGAVIPLIKRVVRKINYAECRALVDEVRKYTTESEVKRKINEFVKQHLSKEIDLFN